MTADEIRAYNGDEVHVLQEIAAQLAELVAEIREVKKRHETS